MYLGWVATNPQLADVRVRASVDGVESLSDAETRQWRAFTAAEFRIWENTFYQYERGLFTEPEYHARRKTWRARLIEGPSSSYYRARWAEIGDRFSPTFREEIEEILSDEGVQD